jgi:hypothetical protein
MIWIFIVVLVVLVILTFTKFEIRKEIDINATVNRVWAVIIDFENYKNWSTQLTYLGGEVKLHQKLHLKLSAEGAAPYEFEPIVSHWEENKKFAWLARTGLPRIFDGEHFFELNDLGNGRTQVINREEYRGLLSMIIRQLPMMKTAPQGFEKMNAELKAFVESNVSAPSN